MYNDKPNSLKPTLVDVKIEDGIYVPMIVYVLISFSNQKIEENCAEIQEEVKTVLTVSEDSPFFNKKHSDLELSAVKALSEKEVEYLRDTVGLSVF